MVSLGTLTPEVTVQTACLIDWAHLFRLLPDPWPLLSDPPKWISRDLSGTGLASATLAQCRTNAGQIYPRSRCGGDSTPVGPAGSRVGPAPLSRTQTGHAHLGHPLVTTYFCHRLLNSLRDPSILVESKYWIPLSAIGTFWPHIDWFFSIKILNHILRNANVYEAPAVFHKLYNNRMKTCGFSLNYKLHQQCQL